MTTPDERTAARSELESLLRDTARGQHQAFLDTGGEHPEWAMWYAENMHGPLEQALDVETTRSELVYLLVRLSKEHPEEAPEIDWVSYYADALLEHYHD